MTAKHVLVVDDEADNRGLLRQLLRRAGHRVSEARDGQEALAMIERDPPDLMLLDLMMPAMDGFEVLKRLATRHGGFLPVVVVTANTEREARLRALQLGAQEFLTKPIDRGEVTVRVRTLLELKAARDALEARAQVLEDEVAQRTHELRDAHAQLQARAHKLELAYEALQRADRYKDDFLSVISHELRTPLNFISGFGSLLVEGAAGKLNDEQTLYLTKMLEGANRLEGLVSNLLDVASIQAGRLKFTPHPHDYRALVGQAIERMRPEADAKGIALASDVRLSQPVVLDGQRMHQVLSQLISNGIKFTPPGGRVTVKARFDEDLLVTEVVDTGSGIAAEAIPHVFTPFKQLDMSTTREAGGIGLGLTICKAVVEAHGGQIGVLSAEGKGSTFWFSLPLTGPRGVLMAPGAAGAEVLG
ncbi:MAG TPA: hybrid sensor histidine kinase/response regulator [Pantanalinema sp.]